MKSVCVCGNTYIAEEVKALGRAVEQNRRRLSRTSGREVDFSVAKHDFTDKHLHEFARGFHLLFCGEMCPERRKCQVDWYAYCIAGRDAINGPGADGPPPDAQSLRV